jgi:hypothetical protein
VPDEPPVAIYHLHVKNISRVNGRSAVAAAAYRAGETLPNEMEEKDSAFAGKRDVLFSEIRLPNGAPDWMSDRAKLWNNVEAAERRKDARLAKEIEFSLPRELSREVWLPVAREMADAFVALGHVVDLAIHDDGSGHNPHVHLLLTTRQVTADGFGLKLREADGVAFVNKARQTWQQIANVALGKAGAAVQVDARSHAARGIDQRPTTHRGPDPAERRAKRWGRAMNDDMLEARRELLAERGARDRFPLLSARPDWPPERRQPVPGLDPQELTEWRSFWHEVDKRAWGEELHPPRGNDERISLEARDPVRAGAVAKAVTEQALAGGHAREATLENAMADWKVLHAAVMERMRADGHQTDDPLSDWTRVERSMRDFHATLTQLQVRDAQRRALEPVPDPDGRPISQSALDQAEDRMLAEHEHVVVEPPNSGPDRDAARAAVERQNAMEVSDRDAEAYRLAPQESRLDWLDAKPVSRPEARGDDRLDWLAPMPSRQEREADRERDR